MLSKTRVTSAREAGGRPAPPQKSKSSDRSALNPLVDCPPVAQATASTMLDLPEPLGPTITVIPGSSSRVVRPPKDLNPAKVMDFKSMGKYPT